MGKRVYRESREGHWVYHPTVSEELLDYFTRRFNQIQAEHERLGIPKRVNRLWDPELSDAVAH